MWQPVEAANSSANSFGADGSPGPMDPSERARPAGAPGTEAGRTTNTRPGSGRRGELGRWRLPLLLLGVCCVPLGAGALEMAVKSQNEAASICKDQQALSSPELRYMSDSLYQICQGEEVKLFEASSILYKYTTGQQNVLLTLHESQLGHSQNCFLSVTVTSSEKQGNIVVKVNVQHLMTLILEQALVELCVNSTRTENGYFDLVITMCCIEKRQRDPKIAENVTVGPPVRNCILKNVSKYNPTWYQCECMIENWDLHTCHASNSTVPSEGSEKASLPTWVIYLVLSIGLCCLIALGFGIYWWKKCPRNKSTPNKDEYLTPTETMVDCNGVSIPLSPVTVPENSVVPSNHEPPSAIGLSPCSSL